MSELTTLFIALGLGAAIGLERKLNDHSAGIHTHALVALGSCLFILLGIKLAAPGEMARVASQVVMGIGFLGGAVIMRDGLQVRGINTAVTIWCSSAIGAIVGAGYYMLACEGASVIVIANFILHVLEHRSGFFYIAPPSSDDKKN
ncbi:MAG: MgtC/SapB family protein [Alphaproteobacteria bacterium]